MSPSLQDWVWVEAMFIEAMVGAISPNFREVVLFFKEDEWHLQVTLEKENEEDRDEVGEIVAYFSIYLEDVKEFISKTAYVKTIEEVVVNDGELDYSTGPNKRVLYRRREKISTM